MSPVCIGKMTINLDPPSFFFTSISFRLWPYTLFLLGSTVFVCTFFTVLLLGDRFSSKFLLNWLLIQGRRWQVGRTVKLNDNLFSFPVLSFVHKPKEKKTKITPPRPLSSLSYRNGRHFSTTVDTNGVEYWHSIQSPSSSVDYFTPLHPLLWSPFHHDLFLSFLSLLFTTGILQVKVLQIKIEIKRLIMFQYEREKGGRQVISFTLFLPIFTLETEYTSYVEKYGRSELIS